MRSVSLNVNIISDKEVGVLWRWLHGTQAPTPLEVKAIMLIRKLVEERSRNKRLQRHMEDCGHWSAPEGQPPLDRTRNEETLSLYDFGIDPATWAEE